jgi:hypothetical protein
MRSVIKFSKIIALLVSAVHLRAVMIWRCMAALASARMVGMVVIMAARVLVRVFRSVVEFIESGVPGRSLIARQDGLLQF